MHTWKNKEGPYSQDSQDMYLNKIFSVIHPTKKYFFEFSFNEEGYKTDGSGANMRKLYEEDWRSLLLDGSNKNVKTNF